MSGLINLVEAQKRLLALVRPGPAQWMDTGAAQGLFLAEDITANRTQPPANLSAMDGYAICGEGPWQRVGESRAGAPFNGPLKEGECLRISTGAHMPDGSDRVLIQENASVQGPKIALSEGEQLPPPDRHVRNLGFDFNHGQTVLKSGVQIGPAQIALALSAGLSQIPVRAPPSIAVLDSGDELASDPANCPPDQIPASNGAMIEAMLRPLGCDIARIGPVADDMDGLAAALSRAENADIVITTGGASVGDHDLIQKALDQWGAQIGFWKVAIKPGKPLMVATRGAAHGRQVILGLPGNPVSSFVTAFLFALPLVRAALGSPAPLPLSKDQIADEDLPATGSRQEFLRAISDGSNVLLAASQDSSALLALANANCLIDRPARSPAVAKGGIVPVYNLQTG